MKEIAHTPKPPYFAVIFTSKRTDFEDEYADVAEEMFRLASIQPGFLGVESADDGLGITVSYWASLEAIQAWKRNERHMMAQDRGRADWYREYKTRVCKVERDYEYEAD
ncbi:antibiotic biosynthesis monooxygenase [Alicyclobacillus sp. SO9]|uniref:antibiotic biosynthesis monooxygenase family protein n=1 Tax=Alicyclobacillus sp. SO9 TaxID=2665646 RepID=UPI0018E8045B|nr:antibiotic biosynthesis monooxygenase [Alicyclobacillus sp. SO9]QQE79762.1 antibiotic biosynthesis monooxygenase [Alicyclobacillus sp. SO9]